MIPKSVTPARIYENFKEVELSPEDVATIDALGKEPKRFNVPLIASKSSINSLVHSFVYNASADCHTFSTDKPRWDVNIFGEESEKPASHKVILSV